MYNPTGLSSSQIGSNVQQALLGLRTSAEAAAHICEWVVAQSADDLVAVGFTSEAAETLISTCGNILNLINGANGGPPAPQLDYLTNALDVIGPFA